LRFCWSGTQRDQESHCEVQVIEIELHENLPKGMN
jgi:hypothetical protein